MDTDVNSENHVENGGYGGQYASNAVRLAIISPMVIKSNTGRQILIQDHASGTPLPEIRLRVVDSFGNTVTSGIADAGHFLISLGRTSYCFLQR